MIMISHDMKIVLTIASLILSTIGFFIAALFLGPPAIACALLVLLMPSGELKLEMRYKIMAFIGLYVGIMEVVFGILMAAGVLVVP
ncbi:MAG: hypothetical protein LUQ65_12405 [Candidatus Helarchaeota archaeon]|nr:hypothetical protein [Candidatus Helarchaeota archaeon]